MKITKLFTLGLLGSLLLNSCSSDDDNNFVEPTTPTEGDNGPSEPTPTEDAAYTNGVFVVNEGSQSAGTVSFLDAANTSIENNIFETVKNKRLRFLKKRFRPFRFPNLDLSQSQI